MAETENKGARALGFEPYAIAQDEEYTNAD